MNVVVLPEITPRNGVVHMKAPFTCVNMQIVLFKYYSLAIFSYFIDENTFENVQWVVGVCHYL
jgi:hypothetical protein